MDVKHLLFLAQSPELNPHREFVAPVWAPRTHQGTTSEINSWGGEILAVGMDRNNQCCLLKNFDESLPRSVVSVIAGRGWPHQ